MPQPWEMNWGGPQQAPQPAQQPGPVLGPPPKPKEPPQPKTTYRTLSPDEVKARGLNPDTVYQISSEGSVTAVSGQKNADKPTEYQAKSAGFLGRMIQAENQFNSVPADSRDARTVPGQFLHDWAPGIDATFNSSDRNTADNAARNFIAATLRQESGAAISAQEYENQYRIFFPMPGDTEQQIREKEAARKQAIEGFKIAAGPLADRALESVQAIPSRQQGQVKEPEMRGGLPVGTQIKFGMDGGPDNFFDRSKYLQETFGIAPDTESKLIGFWGTNSGNTALTVEAAKGWYQSNGIPLPTDADMASMVEQAKQAAPGTQWAGFDTTAAEQAYRQQLQGALNATGFDPNSKLALTGPAVQGVTLGLYDEAAGAAAGLGALASGDSPVAAYQARRDMERLANQQIGEAQPKASFATEFGAGMLLPVGAAKQAASAPTTLARGVELAKSGAKIGGVAGFGYGQGLGGSTANALLGAGVGGIAAPALGVPAEFVAGKVGNALAARESRKMAGIDTEALAAMQRQNIPVRAPDVNPATRPQTAALAKGDGQASQIIGAAKAEDLAAIENRVMQIGGNTGAEKGYNLGQQVQQVGKNYIERSGKSTGLMYDQVDKLAGKARVSPQNAIAEVDRNIAELTAQGAQSNKAQIDYLRGLKSDLEKQGGFSITEFQGLRSANKAKIRGDNALTASDATRRLDGIVKAFSADAEAQLPKNATKMLQRADQAYAERQTFIKNTLQEFLGKDRNNPLAPERAAERLVSMAGKKGNYDKLSRFWKEASPEDAQDFTSAIAGELLKGRNGAVSLPALAKNIEDLPANTRALLFGPEGSKALKDIQIIARSKIAAGEASAPSGAAISDMKRGARSAVFSLLGYGAGGPAGAVAVPMAERFFSALGERRAARLLMNPDVTKWLKEMPEATNPKAIDRYFSKLEGAAARTPSITGDIEAMKQALAQAFSQSPARAAAAPSENEPNRR